MNSLRSWLILGFSTVSLLGMLSCSSQPIMRMEEKKELPQDLPTNFKDKFEVKSEIDPSQAKKEDEASAPPAVPVESLTATADAKSETKKKATPPPASVKTKKPTYVSPHQRPAVDPLRVGEKAVYEFTYFGVVGGEISISVKPFKYINNRKVYHLFGEAKSSALFSVFYRVEDSIESFWDYDGLYSTRFHMVLNESKQTRDSLELYDSEKAETFYWNRWDHYRKGYTETKETNPMTRFPQDSLSALYFIRMVPLPDKGKVTFPVVSEGKSWELEIEVVRREQLKTKAGKFPAVLIKPETKFQGVMKKTGDVLVWISDDDRRILLRIEGKVKIGSIVGELVKFEPGQN